MAVWEWQAYKTEIRDWAKRSQQPFKDDNFLAGYILRQFATSNYGWMFPFFGTFLMYMTKRVWDKAQQED